MARTNSTSAPPVDVADDTVEGPEPKRRKIRKGTRSCWACKRRKVRCIFDDDPTASGLDPEPGTAVCRGCQQRGTACVGQDYPEEADPGATGSPVHAVPGAPRHVGDRLGRMEALVERLVQTQTRTPQSRIVKQAYQPWLVPRQRGEGREGDKAAEEGIPTPEWSESDGPAYMNWSGRAVHNSLERETLTEAAPTPVGNTSDSGQHTRAGKYADISKDLMAAWPLQADVAILCNIKEQTAGLLQRAFCKPFSKLSAVDMGVEPPVTCPPPEVTYHPVIIARKMLSLAIMLQNLHPQYHTELHQLSVPHRELARRTAERAITLVTTNEELIGSLEGLECLALEGIYQTNCGNLRRSWLAFHRATTLAQLMRIHKGADSPSLRILELQTRQRIDPEHLWFRILYTDRYLSLMLGLPAATYINNFTTLPTSDDVDNIVAAQDRLGYVHAMIAGRILERNERDLDDEAYTMTRDIDTDLQRATRTMPAQWWLSPSAADCAGDDPERQFRESARLVDQLYHYFLLTQLHLPYMLRLSTASRRYDYSKVACINASREILVRYVAYRQVNLVAFTYRGVEFFTFLASMTLLLGHLDNHQRGTSSNHDSYLVHQRLGDRGLVEKVMDYLEERAELNADLLSRQSAGILRRMLVIEDDAADGGGVYSTSTTAREDDCGTVGVDGAITLSVPYFGLIRIAKEGVSRPRADAEGDIAAAGAAAQKQKQKQGPSHKPSGFVAGDQLLGGWQLGSITASTETPVPRAEEAVPEDLGPYEESGAQQTLMPGLTAEADDWAFQGVDMAFFDRLMAGTVNPETGTPSGEMGQGWAF